MTDQKDHLAELKKAAEGGNAEAQGQLGTILAMGEGVEQDLPEAHRWLNMAAEGGDLTAMFNLGIMYEKGLGAEADLGQACLWFWLAAEAGDTGAKMKLGTMIIMGQGFAPDSPAVQAIEASADKGIPYAQSFLGKLYLDGVGLEQNDAEAEKWFARAAEQGDESGIFNIGEMIALGHNVDITDDTVAKWFYDLAGSFLMKRDVVKAFDCLVSIKRIDPDHFLAKRLEDEIERENESQQST
jgi:TPR repeat protein